jgi:hypothetical protein
MLGKAFVYLMDGLKPICYWRGLASEFTEPDPKNRWIPLKTDRAIDMVKNDYEAGMIQIRMSI